MAASLINFRGDIIEYCVLDTLPGNPARTLLDLKRHYLDTLKHIGISSEKVCGVGYSMAGFLYDARKYFNPPEPLKNWMGIDLRREIMTLFDRPVWIENNATTAAHAEAFWARACTTRPSATSLLITALVAALSLTANRFRALLAMRARSAGFFAGRGQTASCAGDLN